ncbi:MAG: BrnT family toxin [Lachnospiraceae bacterium]|nr:BrnT family toxin [Lachnospiraceae bacterium]
MRFEWDESKNELNKRKHRVSFEEAREIFYDPFHIAILDERFHYLEERWITIGRTSGSHLVVAAHLYFDEQGQETIRIISARRATAHEREQYEGES